MKKQQQHFGNLHKFLDIIKSRRVIIEVRDKIQRGGFSRPLSTIIVFVGVESRVAVFVGLL